MFLGWLSFRLTLWATLSLLGRQGVEVGFTSASSHLDLPSLCHFWPSGTVSSRAPGPFFCGRPSMGLPGPSHLWEPHSACSASSASLCTSMCPPWTWGVGSPHRPRALLLSSVSAFLVGSSLLPPLPGSGSRDARLCGRAVGTKLGYTLELRWSWAAGQLGAIRPPSFCPAAF